MCVYLCARADANKAAVAAKGGIEAVVAAMRRHAGVAGVAEYGCAALWNIAELGRCSAVVCPCSWGAGRAAAVRSVSQCAGAATRTGVHGCLRVHAHGGGR